MNLKKSDKIIALVAVVILVIAAIGIILYTEKEPVKIPVKEEMFLYTVEVDKPSQRLVTPDNTVYSMTDKKPYTGTFDVNSDNLKDIDIYVEYKDIDHGLFKKLRKNTITITVYDEAEKEISSAKITGMGNVTLNIPGSNPLNIDQIIAKDINEAQQKLAENLSNTGLTQKYTIKVTVKYGEVRYIRKLFERLQGDSLTTLQITENHYVYKLVEQNQTTGNDNLSGESLNSMVLTYRTLCYPGFQ